MEWAGRQTFRNHGDDPDDWDADQELERMEASLVALWSVSAAELAEDLDVYPEALLRALHGQAAVPYEVYYITTATALGLSVVELTLARVRKGTPLKMLDPQAIAQAALDKLSTTHAAAAANMRGQASLSDRYSTRYSELQANKGHNRGAMNWRGASHNYAACIDCCRCRSSRLRDLYQQVHQAIQSAPTHCRHRQSPLVRPRAHALSWCSYGCFAKNLPGPHARTVRLVKVCYYFFYFLKQSKTKKQQRAR